MGGLFFGALPDCGGAYACRILSASSASAASALAWFALRELAAASRRFDDFVRELARFNELFGDR